MRAASSFLTISSILICLTVVSPDAMSKNGPWRKVDNGLFLGQFDPFYESPVKDSKIIILKINPTYYSFKLLCASELGRIRLTPKEWCKKYNLIAAINAGMYQKDGLTNVGYMKNYSHLNNPRLNSAYKAVLAFNRVDFNAPEIQIIDLKCQDFEKLRPKYQTFIQGIRMISCNQENVWSKQDRRWSLGVLGVDKEGSVLFILSEAPYSGYDFNNTLLSLPLSIFNATYLEGGPEASLYFSATGTELEKVGIYGTGLNGSAVRSGAYPIPNVIGIIKKTN
ncbi:MAG: phosphodiester glycosidase family protein [Desulfobacterales bacterium]|nr:phosphodiester glycosidase family protein [Desulfobacterales bacterium]